MIQVVKKYLVILLIALLFLSSCVSGKKGVDDSETDAAEREAVTVLAGDMVSALQKGALAIDDIAPALNESYREYEDYLPSYDEIRDRYLGAVLLILEDDFVTLFKESVLSSASSLSQSPRKYLMGEMLSPEVESATRTFLSLSFGSLIDEREEKMKEAFLESGESFSMVKKAYDNLNVVGVSEKLPEAEEIDKTSLITLVLDRYYSILEEEEIKLRTNPLYGDSTYRLFWESFR